MKINTLSIWNYRGVKSLSMSLNETMNVFLGDNGSGKSTILDAMAIMLSWVVSRVKHSSASGRPITETDIANGTSRSGITLNCVDDSQAVLWSLVKHRRGYGGYDEKSDLSSLNSYAKRLQAMTAAKEEKLNLPLFVYYPVNRAVLDIPLRIRERHRFTLFAAYDEALTSGANFRTFFEWFREREDLENENRKYVNDLFKPDDFQFPDPQLEAVRMAIEQFLPEFKNLTVRRNPLRMEIEKNEKRLTVNQLSDGEQCLMALVGDLARRLAIANPVREKPLEGKGIVMVDEIDLHLHPKWQRMIVPKLSRVFPNLQFIISTHSPHVVTHVRPEHLFLLAPSDEGVVSNHPIESYGKNVDRVLEDLMGLETTRPDEVNRKLVDLFETISDGDLDRAVRQVEELRGLIGDDPELAKASVLIKRKEIIGK